MLGGSTGTRLIVSKAKIQSVVSRAKGRVSSISTTPDKLLLGDGDMSIGMARQQSGRVTVFDAEVHRVFPRAGQDVDIVALRVMKALRRHEPIGNRIENGHVVVVRDAPKSFAVIRLLNVQRRDATPEDKRRIVGEAQDIMNELKRRARQQER